MGSKRYTFGADVREIVDIREDIRPRKRLLTTLLSSRSVLRFICAPRGFGKSTLAFEYSEMTFGSAGTFWVDCHDPSFICSIDDGTFPRCFLPGSRPEMMPEGPEADGAVLVDAADGAVIPRLIVFDDLCFLDTERAAALSAGIDELMSNGVEVIVDGTPANDCLRSLQADRVYLGACDLLVSEDELELEPEVEGQETRRFAEYLGIPSLLWVDHDAGVEACTRGFFEEGLPREISLLAACMFILQEGRVSDLLGLGLKVPDDVRKLLSSCYPFVGLGALGDGFSSLDVPIPVLLGCAGDLFTAPERRQLVDGLRTLLVSRGRAARAIELSEMLYDEEEVLDWLFGAGADLVDKGSAAEVKSYIDGRRMLLLEQRGELLPLYAWASYLAGDSYGAAFLCGQVDGTGPTGAGASPAAPLDASSHIAAVSAAILRLALSRVSPASVPGNEGHPGAEPLAPQLPGAVSSVPECPGAEPHMSEHPTAESPVPRLPEAAPHTSDSPAAGSPASKPSGAKGQKTEVAGGGSFEAKLLERLGVLASCPLNCLSGHDGAGACDHGFSPELACHCAGVTLLAKVSLDAARGRLSVGDWSGFIARIGDGFPSSCGGTFLRLALHLVGRGCLDATPDALSADDVAGFARLAMRAVASGSGRDPQSLSATLLGGDLARLPESVKIVEMGGSGMNPFLLQADGPDAPEEVRAQCARADALVDALLDPCGAGRADGGHSLVPAAPDLVVNETRVPLLYIRLFGGFEAFLDGVRSDADLWRSQKVRLFYLLLLINKGNEVLRSTLFDRLWPDSDEKHARDSYYSLFAEMKKQLGIPRDAEFHYVTRSQYGCRINRESLGADILEFDETARDLISQPDDGALLARRYARIDELYRGDLFTPDIETLDFEPAKVRYREMYVDTMIDASSRSLEMGNTLAALWFARKAHEHGTGREDVCRALMSALLATGQRTSAISAFEECRRYLRDELGVEPSESTIELYNRAVMPRRAHRNRK